MPNLIQGGVFFIVSDRKHFLLHLVTQIMIAASIDGGFDREAGSIQEFFGPQAVKLYPGVFPGVFFVCNVRVYLLRGNKKALVAL